MGMNGVSLWFHHTFSSLLMNISLDVTDSHLVSSMKCFFISYTHGLLVLSWVVWLFLTDIGVLYFLDIDILLIIGIADNFSQFVSCSCSFSFFYSFFGVFWWMEVNVVDWITIFSLQFVLFVNCLIILPYPEVKHVFLSLSKSCKIFPSNPVYLGLILMNGVRSRSVFFSFFFFILIFFFLISNPLSQHHPLRVAPFLLICLVTSSMYVCALLRSLSLGLETILLPVYWYHCFIFCDFIILAW